MSFIQQTIIFLVLANILLISSAQDQFYVSLFDEDSQITHLELIAMRFGYCTITQSQAVNQRTATFHLTEAVKLAITDGSLYLIPRINNYWLNNYASIFPYKEGWTGVTVSYTSGELRFETNIMGVFDYGSLQLKRLLKVEVFVHGNNSPIPHTAALAFNNGKKTIEVAKAEPPPKVSKPCFFSFGFHAQPTVTHPHTSVNIEIDAYVKDRCTEPDEDILAWWRKNENLYPILSTLASKYHSASSTSVASEQLFSAARDVYHHRRMRLDPKSAEMILF